MAVVSATREETLLQIGDRADVVLANHNAPRQVVLSGPRASLDDVLQRVTAEAMIALEIIDRRLRGIYDS